MDGVSHSAVVVGGSIQDVVEAIRLLDVWARRAEAISCVGWALYISLVTRRIGTGKGARCPTTRPSRRRWGV